MNLIQQINYLAIQIARLSSFNSKEIKTERETRKNELLKTQADIVESVVDEYNAIIGG